MLVVRHGGSAVGIDIVHLTRLYAASNAPTVGVLAGSARQHMIRDDSGVSNRGECGDVGTALTLDPVVYGYLTRRNVGNEHSDKERAYAVWATVEEDQVLLLDGQD